MLSRIRTVDRGDISYPCPTGLDQLWGSATFLFSGYGRPGQLLTHPCLLPRLSTSGAILYLGYTLEVWTLAKAAAEHVWRCDRRNVSCRLLLRHLLRHHFHYITHPLVMP